VRVRGGARAWGRRRGGEGGVAGQRAVCCVSLCFHPHLNLQITSYPKRPSVRLFGVMTIPDIAREGADFVNRLKSDNVWVSPRADP
jgi:hypothetical protein